MVLEKGRESPLFASFIELFITTPKSSGVGRGVSQRKSSACVEVTPTQQHNNTNPVTRTLFSNPSLIRRLKRLTKDPRKPFIAFNEHLQILQNSSTDLTPFGFLPAHLSSITRLNEH